MHAMLIFFLAFVGGWSLFPVLVGRTHVMDPVAEKRIPASSLEAEQLTNSGLASLLPFGFDIGPNEPLPDGGWSVTTSRMTIGLSGDPRRAKQSLEFSFAGRELVMTHRLWGSYVETGELDYQHWLLGAIADGRPLDEPPPTLMAKPLCALSSGLLLFADALLIQNLYGVGGAGRAAFLAAMSSAVTTYLGMAVIVGVQRRWTRGASLFIPAAILLASAMSLWAYLPRR
jgi:hypothetical protein